VLRAEKQCTAGAGHNKKERRGKARQEATSCQHAWAHKQCREQSAVTVTGSISLPWHAKAYNLSSRIITCRQLEQGSPETKAMNTQSISFLFPLCLKFSWPGKRKILVWRSMEQVTLLLNKVGGGQDTHHHSQSLLLPQ